MNSCVVILMGDLELIKVLCEEDEDLTGAPMAGNDEAGAAVAAVPFTPSSMNSAEAPALSPAPEPTPAAPTPTPAETNTGETPSPIEPLGVNETKTAPANSNPLEDKKDDFLKDLE